MRIDALGGMGISWGGRRRGFGRATLLCGLICCVFCLPADGASAQLDAVKQAIKYLVEHQNADNTWSDGERQMVDTFEAVKAIAPYIADNQDANRAANRSLNYVIDVNEKSNDQLARKLSILGGSSYDSSSLRASLLAAQNADGGWGISAGKQSSIVDTILAVDALLKAGFAGGELAAARSYLVGQQSAQGCWVLADEAGVPGDIARTALGLIVLKDLEAGGFGDSALRAAVAKAQQYLENVSEPNDVNQLDTADLALIYRALLRVEQPYDLRDLLSELLRRQLANGSWENNVFVTALALETLTVLSARAQGDCPYPDLAVYADYIRFDPASPSTGQDVVITASITNEGTGDAGGFYVKFYNGDPNNGGQLIGSAYYVSGIAAGSSADASVTLTGTEGLFDEQYIVVAVDPARDVNECNHANNFAYKVLAFTGQPDLQITAGDIHVRDVNGNDFTGNPGAYEPVAIVAEVTNIGGRFEGSFDVNVFDTADPYFGHTFTFGSMAHNQKAVATLTIGLPPGNRTVRVAADQTDLLSESNEGNNTADKSITVEQGSAPSDTSDLRIGASDIVLSDANAAPGDTIDITFTIHNDGTAASGDFKVLISDGSPYVQGYYRVDEVDVSSIAPGQSVTETVSYTVGYRPNGNEIFVVADSKWQVVEANKQNNVASKRFGSGAIADLTSSAELIEVSHYDLTVSRSVQVRATVRNIGGRAADNVKVLFAYKYSSDPNYYVFGEDVIASIAAHGTGQAESLWLPAANTSYTLCVLIDNDQQIPESNEQNNIAEKSGVEFYFGASEPDIKLYLGAAQTEQYTFGAYDSVRIEIDLDAHYYDANQFLRLVWIESPDGQYYQPQYGFGEGFAGEDVWFFNTGLLEPGEYKVLLDVIDLQTFEIVQSDEQLFNIEGESDLHVVLLGGRQYLRIGSKLQVDASFRLYSWSNRQVADANVTLRLYSDSEPCNPVHIWSDVEGEYAIGPGEELEPNVNGFMPTIAGNYTLVAEVLYDFNGVSYENNSKSTRKVSVLPAMGLGIFKSIFPERLNPADRATVDARIDAVSLGMLPKDDVMDVVIVLDVSGSMEGEKIIKEKKAAAIFAERLLTEDVNDRVGVVAFSYSASVPPPLEPGELTRDFNDVNSAIDSLSAGDGTCIQQGVYLANSILVNSPAHRKKIMVLLSDGVQYFPCTDADVLEAAAESADEDTTIITAGVGADSGGGQLLAEVADITGGSSYYCDSPETILDMYNEIFAELTSYSIEEVRIVDKVAYEPNLTELDVSSIEPPPTSLRAPNIGDANYTIVWNLPSLKVGESALYGYRVELYDLLPGEERVVNRLLTVSSSAGGSGGEPSLEIGPQGVFVNDITSLAIEADSNEYNTGQTATFTVDFQVPAGIEHKLITSRDDFLAGEPNHVDVNSGEGNVILERNGERYYSQGILSSLFVDAGQGVFWGDITFGGGFPDEYAWFNRTNNYLRSNLVEDVFFYDRSGESGNWWEDSSKSWYAEAQATIVDHALITDDGWAVLVPVTTALDSAMDGNDFSIEGWISAETDGVMFYRGDGNHYLRISKRQVSGDRIYVDYEGPADSNSQWVQLTGDSNAWHYVALTVDDSAAKLYVDGNTVCRTWSYNGGDVMGSLGGKSIIFGAEPNQPDANSYVLSSCRADEVSVYNRVLDPNDIGRYLSDNLAHRPAAEVTGLVGYWNFDPSAVDQSGFGIGGQFIKADPNRKGLRRITGRSSQAQFPLHSYIVATADSVEIIDADSHSLWMRIPADRVFLWDANEIHPGSVFAGDGRVYVGQEDRPAGLAIVDFVEDTLWAVTAEATRRLEGTIFDERFGTVNSFVHWTSLPKLANGHVNGIAVARTAGTSYFIAGTWNGANIMWTDFEPDEGPTPRSDMMQRVGGVFVCDANDLYLVGKGEDGDSVYALYDCESQSAFCQPADAVYGYLDQNEPNLFSNRISDIFVQPGADGNNILYIATTMGLVRIEEDRNNRSLGRRTVYLSKEYGPVADGNIVAVLEGDSNIITAVYFDDARNELWVGTSAGTVGSTKGLQGIGTVTILDPNGVVKGHLDGQSRPKLGYGTINCLSYGAVGTSEGLLLFEPSRLTCEPIAVRARSVYTSNLDEPGDAVSDWTNWITKSGTLITDSNIIDPNSTNRPGRSRYLELEARLDTPDANVTPVLEWLNVGYTPGELGIDVTVEDPAGAEAGRCGTILITNDLMGRALRFEKYFDTGSVMPGDYSTVARLYDLVGGDEIQKAGDDFSILGSVSPAAVLSCDVRTDKRFYYGGDKVTVIATVTNTSASEPADNVLVTIAVTDPNGNSKDISPGNPGSDIYTYSIGSLQPGAVDVRTLTFDVGLDWDIADSYVVLQQVNEFEQDHPSDSAVFDVRGNCENLSALVGSINVTPSIIKQGRSVVGIRAGATNAGNQKLSDVRLFVKVQDINNPADPYTVKLFEQYVGRMAAGQHTSFELQYMPVGLAKGTYPVVLSASYICADSNQSRDLALGGFTVVEEVNNVVSDYVLIDLGTVDDGNCYAYGLNDYGSVTGYAMVGGQSHAFLYKCGQMTDMDPCGLFGNSAGWGINRSEQIVGSFKAASAAGDANTFIWQGGDFADIGTGPNGAYPVVGRGINVNGQVTGWYTLSSGARRAFVWSDPADGQPYWDDLSASGIFDGDNFAFGINDSAGLAGYWRDGADTKGFVRRDGVIRDIGKYENGDSYLQAINSYGQAVGYVKAGDSNEALVYENGAFIIVDTNESRAYGINDKGEVVGTRVIGGEPKAFIARGGSVHNLNDLLVFRDSRANWWNLTEARAINADSRITGFGTIDGRTRAFRLDPLAFEVKEPNLVLWLRADAGVERDAQGNVSRWINQTFNGDDLTATGSSRPLFITDTTCCEPLVSFDGVDDYLSGTLGSAYSGDSTIFLVVHTTADSNGALFASDIDDSGSNEFEIGVTDGDPNLHLATNGGANIYGISTKATEAVILEVVIAEPNGSFYKNGRLLRTASLSSGDASKYTHYVLGRSRAGVYLEYGAAEVLVFDGALSDARRRQVELYLSEKHSLYGPADIEQPQLWYEADAAVTMDQQQRVSKWADQSGNDYDATQEEPARQPQWQSGIFGCKPAILFDGTNLDPNALIGRIDTYLIVDSSYSMNSRDNNPKRRIEYARDAAEAYAREVLDDPDDANDGDYGHRAGLISFASYSSTEMPLTKDCAALVSKIGSLDCYNYPNYYTNYSDALQRMINEFSNSTAGSGEGQQRVCIFLSDGLPNQPGGMTDAERKADILNKVDEARAAGITLWTIGVGGTVDINDQNNYKSSAVELLQEMAEHGGGKYNETPDASQLQGIFLQIYYEIVEMFSKQTLSMVFRTADDVSSRQVIWALGDPNKGMNLYIDDGYLYFGAWHLLDNDGNGPETIWGPVYMGTPVDANTAYLVDCVYDSSASSIEGYLNGASFGSVSGVGRFFPQQSRITIGNNPEQPTLFHDGSIDVNNFFTGYVGEILYYNKALSEEARRKLDFYLGDKYGIDIRRNRPALVSAGQNINALDSNWDNRSDVNLSAYAADDAAGLACKWYEGDVLLAEGINPTVSLGVGMHVIELRVTDSDGQITKDTVVVTVKAVTDELDSTDLIRHLKFDGDANDASGNGFNAELVNVSEPNCWIDGPYGHAVRLNADNNEYIDLGADANNIRYLPGGSHARTIMGWFEARDNPDGTFFDYGRTDANDRSGRFAVTASSSRVAVTVGSQGHTVGTETAVPLRGWHHIAVVLPEGASRSNQVMIYLDGVQKDITTLGGEPVAINTNTWSDSSYGYIGRDYRGDFFDGGIDDVRIYARALSAGEIRSAAGSILCERYHVVELGPVESAAAPHEGEARAINNQGQVVGSSTIYLDPNTMYYWRVDEKNACGVTEGQTWDFTTGSHKQQ
jgi:probable HAF family extracellular repeat protein